MKQLILLVIFSGMAFIGLYGQSLSINATGVVADPTAMLDVSSNIKGLLIPRMSKVQKNAIVSPAAGLLVYQNSPDSIGFYYYNGASWLWLNTANAGWSVTGNRGTDTAVNFVGTIDNMPLRLRQNNNRVAQFNSNDQNFFIGSNAGRRVNTATKNIAFGDSSFQNNRSGNRNVAIGSNAMAADTGSSQNVAIGANSLQNGLVSSINVAVGYNTLRDAGLGRLAPPGASFEGDYNTAIGYSAASAMQTGFSNVSIGAFAQNADTSGSGNTIIGSLAGYNQLLGFQNTALGWFSLYNNINGSFNTALGSNTMQSKVTGNSNVAIGINAMSGDTASSENVAVGASSLQNGRVTQYNVAVGYQSLRNAGVGRTAPPSGSNFEGDYNTAVGYNAGSSIRRGASNVSIGAFAHFTDTIGSGNTIIGASAGYNQIGTTGNTAVGWFSLYATTNGFSNTALGTLSGNLNESGTNNTFIGINAGSTNVSGIGNTFLGSASNVSSGALNNAAAIGFRSYVTQSNSLILGSINGTNGATASTNVGIGTTSPNVKLHIEGGSDASLSSNSGYMVLGDVAGANVVFDNNEIIARNNGANSTLFLQFTGGDFEVGGAASKPGGGNWAVASDARLKQHIKPYTDGLQQLLQIKPVQYQYNQLSGYDTQKQYVGVLAQELATVAPYMVNTFSKNGTEYYNVDNSAVTYMLINAVKEQQQQIEELKTIIKELVKK